MYCTLREKRNTGVGGEKNETENPREKVRRRGFREAPCRVTGWEKWLSLLENLHGVIKIFSEYLCFSFEVYYKKTHCQGLGI